MKLAYYPGCSAQSTCAELNTATHVVAKRLGLELNQLHSATCTGSREIRAIDPLSFYALNVRILALAERNNTPVMTVCNTCTLNLLDAQAAFQSDPETAKLINERLAEEGLHYNGTTRITHFLWVLFEEIGTERLRSMVVRPLPGLNVAAFYGCHITRPPLQYGFVDSRNNTALEKLAVIVGSKPIDYSGRTDCCGFHTAAHNEDIPVNMSRKHIESAKENGATAMVTPCPLCHTVLDSLQPDMSRKAKSKLNMPILHLSQLVGLAIGVEPEELGFNHHVVTPSMINRWFGRSPSVVKRVA